MASVVVWFDERTDQKINEYMVKQNLPNRDKTVQEIINKFFKLMRD